MAWAANAAVSPLLKRVSDEAFEGTVSESVLGVEDSKRGIKSLYWTRAASVIREDLAGNFAAPDLPYKWAFGENRENNCELITRSRYHIRILRKREKANGDRAIPPPNSALYSNRAQSGKRTPLTTTDYIRRD